MEQTKINFFAETNFRNLTKNFGILTDDRRRHFYVIGKTGMGKTAMIQNMAVQDIMAGHGVGFVDPHGEAAEALLDAIPSNRVNDVVYFNPADLNFPISFNVMEAVSLQNRHLVAGGLMGVFKKIWPDVWSARMEYILNNTILALLEYPGSPLLGVKRMLSDKDFRSKVVEQITDPVIRAFWVYEFARYNERYEVEASAAIQNKVGQFISNPLIRNIIGQPQSSINMRQIMDDRKILILNLAKGRIGEDNSMLLGALLITKLQLAAMSRVDIPEESRKDFYLYVDEFQNFATESFASILSEARKYRLCLILAHQYIAQMEEEVRDAVFGNVGTLVTFRIGAEDAEFIEKEFSPELTAQDLVNLPKYHIYLKLMIDGVASRPFSAKTLLPIHPLSESYRENIIKVSRERYGETKIRVEEKISKWSGFENLPNSMPEKKDAKMSPQLYDAQCSDCGKATKVIFPPDGKRPIYCKNCLKKIKDQKQPPISPRLPPEKPLQSVSLEKALTSTVVPFRKSKPADKNEKRPRKLVDIHGLQEALKESMVREKGQETPEKK